MASTNITLDELLKRVEELETTWQLIWTSGSLTGANASGVLIPKKYKYIKICANYNGENSTNNVVYYTGLLESFTSVSGEYTINKVEANDYLADEFVVFEFRANNSQPTTDNTYMVFGKLR